MALACIALVARTHRLEAQSSGPSGAALVLAARGYDRANQFDSARGGYEAAAVVLPSIADWLLLRAAGVTPDSLSRAHDYASISIPAARARIPWTEAQARERMGDPAGASRLYDSLGAPVDAFRNQTTVLALAADSASRRALCGRIVAYIVAHSGSAGARGATEVLDRACSPLPLSSELVVGRSAAATGPLPRALAAFDRLATEPDAPALAPEESDAYGMVLSRSHRDADAARVFATLAQPGISPSLSHVAQYQRARALVAEGDKPQGVRLLRTLIRTAPRDTAAADALMLLADLATDQRDDAAARLDFLQVARRFPSSPLAPRARFRAALIAFINGGSAGAAGAAREWDLLGKTYPRAPDATAALYWSGRAWARAGRAARAADRWRSVVTSDPLSYYATLSAKRLHLEDSLLTRAADTTQRTVPVYMAAALQRASLLDSLGMTVEAHFEIDRVVRQAGDTPDAILAAGDALARSGEAARAVGLGWRLVGLANGAVRDPRVLRLIYPLAFADTLALDARARGLDPALVAAVIREESAFNPRAVSGAGARGLMQVMPSIGRQLAESRRLGPWDPSLLDDPSINLSLGVAHLATFQSQEGGSLERTLAAYNAGPSRVRLWATKRGADDPEVFVERIPFTDTRDYVRAIVHGRNVYAALYGL